MGRKSGPRKGKKLQPNGEDIFEGEYVMDERWNNDLGRMQWLLKYKGYPASEAQWLTYNDICDWLLARWREWKQGIGQLDDELDEQDEQDVPNEAKMMKSLRALRMPMRTAKAFADKLGENINDAPNATAQPDRLELDFTKVDFILADTDDEYLLINQPDPVTGHHGRPFWSPNKLVPKRLIDGWNELKERLKGYFEDGIIPKYISDLGAVRNEFVVAFISDTGRDDEWTCVTAHRHRGSLWISEDRWNKIGSRQDANDEDHLTQDDLRMVFPDGGNGITVAELQRAEALTKQEEAENAASDESGEKINANNGCSAASDGNADSQQNREPLPNAEVDDDAGLSAQDIEMRDLVLPPIQHPHIPQPSAMSAILLRDVKVRPWGKVSGRVAAYKPTDEHLPLNVLPPKNF